jgi:hypothetical protein
MSAIALMVRPVRPSVGLDVVELDDAASEVASAMSKALTPSLFPYSFGDDSTAIFPGEK